MGSFLGEIAGTVAALVEGDAGVEGTGVGVEGFHDREAGGNDAEVDFQPDSHVMSGSLGGKRAVVGGGERGKRLHFCDGDADSIPWVFEISLLGGEELGGTAYMIGLSI